MVESMIFQVQKAPSTMFVGLLNPKTFQINIYNFRLFDTFSGDFIFMVGSEGKINPKVFVKSDFIER